MTISSFFKLVELPTKVASVFPFLIGSTFAVYRYGQLNIQHLMIMLVAMLCLDMATTALNNFMDYKLAIKTHGFNYEQHNAIVKYNIKESTVKRTIALLMSVTIGLGLYLVSRTDIIVLLLGMISFFFALIYTWGPFPISRTPLGELVSGGIMGGFITFISLYIHIYDLKIIQLVFDRNMFYISINFIEVIVIALLTLPLIAGIANIMLANNTCDMEDDFENKRFTLPLVIGKENALRLFSLLYGSGYLAILLGVILNWLPLTCLLVLITIVPVRKNVLLFNERQTKKDTFIISVKNFVMISLVYFLSLLIGVLLK